MNEVLNERYRLVREVGRGSHGRVYEAIELMLERRVAIKIAKLPEDAAERSAYLARFRNEIRFISQLDHPTFAQVFEQGLTPDGDPFYVMEFVEGPTVSTILEREGSLSVPVALSIAEQIADALGAAHAKGILHRDVKPANIMVTDRTAGSYRVKLLDLGIAAQLNQSTGLTEGGGFFGSVYYMSPEQIASKSLDARSDVWQLGVTLFEMLTGSLPFARDSSFETMKAIMTQELELNGLEGLPPAIANFLRRCLAKDPADRPGNGAEAARMLDEIQMGLSSAGVSEDSRIVRPGVGRIVSSPAQASMTRTQAIDVHAPTPARMTPKGVLRRNEREVWGGFLAVG